MNPERLAIAAIKTILENSKGTLSKSDWKSISDIANPLAVGFRTELNRSRDTEYHVRHGKTKPVTGESARRKTK